MDFQDDFQNLTLAEMYDRLSKLRMVAIAATLGDDAIIDKLIGNIIDPSPAALPEGAEIADAVDAWLAGGAS